MGGALPFMVCSIAVYYCLYCCGTLLRGLLRFVIAWIVEVYSLFLGGLLLVLLQLVACIIATVVWLCTAPASKQGVVRRSIARQAKLRSLNN